MIDMIANIFPDTDPTISNPTTPSAAKVLHHDLKATSVGITGLSSRLASDEIISIFGIFDIFWYCKAWDIHGHDSALKILRFLEQPVIHL